MRFAGDYLTPTPVEQKPVLPSFNAEDLETTPEMKPGPYFPGQDLMRDKYIRQNPGSGVASIDGQEVALAPAIVKGLGTGIKAYSAYRTGKAVGDGIRDPEAARDSGGLGMKRIVGDLMDNRKESTNGPALRSPYHQ